jgi:hypothetical protein
MAKMKLVMGLAAFAFCAMMLMPCALAGTEQDPEIQDGEGDAGIKPSADQVIPISGTDIIKAWFEETNETHFRVCMSVKDLDKAQSFFTVQTLPFEIPVYESDKIGFGCRMLYSVFWKFRNMEFEACSWHVNLQDAEQDCFVFRLYVGDIKTEIQPTGAWDASGGKITWDIDKRCISCADDGVYNEKYMPSVMNSLTSLHASVEWNIYTVAVSSEAFNPLDDADSNRSFVFSNGKEGVSNATGASDGAGAKNATAPSNASEANSDISDSGGAQENAALPNNVQNEGGTVPGFEAVGLAITVCAAMLIVKRRR